MRGAAISGALLALVAAAFLPALGNGFVFDDDLYVLRNPRVLAGLTAEGVVWAFTSVGIASNWHPLAWISHMVDVSLFGLDPRGHHAVSILLHGVNAVLLFRLLAALTGAVWRPAAAAALFAVHPLRVESVAWVAERKDVLSLLFMLLATATWIGYLRRRGSGRYLGVLAFHAAALASKPMAVTLPLLLLLLDWWPLGRWKSGVDERARRRWSFLVIEKGPLFLLSAFSVALTLAAQSRGGALENLENFPLAARLGNAATSTAGYLAKALWPAKLAAFYPHPGRSLEPGRVAAALLVLAGISAVAWILRRRHPYVSTGWLWYLMALAPVAGLVQVGQQAMADRYTYLPLIGVAVALVWGVDDLTRRLPRRGALLWPAAAVLLASLVLTTRSATAWWRDDRTLFERAAAVTRGNWLAELNLGEALEAEGRPAEAMKRYVAALRVKPDSHLANYNVGNLLFNQGRYEEAIRFYRRAISSQAGFEPAWSNMGYALRLFGRPGESVGAFREAIRLDPDDPYAWNGLGSSLVSLGRIDEARESYLKALSLRPDFAPARDNLAALDAGPPADPRPDGRLD